MSNKPTPRCFKQTCKERPTKIYTAMPGVTISACPKHADDADTLARTGRT